MRIRTTVIVNGQSRDLRHVIAAWWVHARKLLAMKLAEIFIPINDDPEVKQMLKIHTRNIQNWYGNDRVRKTTTLMNYNPIIKVQSRHWRLLITFTDWLQIDLTAGTTTIEHHPDYLPYTQ